MLGGGLGPNQWRSCCLRARIAARRHARHDVALSRLDLHLRPRSGSDVLPPAALDDRSCRSRIGRRSLARADSVVGRRAARRVPALLSGWPPHLRSGIQPDGERIFRAARRAVVVLVYVIDGVLCGLAGFLYAARVGTVTVVLASGWELNSLAAAVIGGVSVMGGSGTVVGAALGAVVLASIDNGLVLMRVPEFWRMFIQGAAIVAAAAADVLIGVQIRKSLQGRTPLQRRGA